MSNILLRGTVSLDDPAMGTSAEVGQVSSGQGRVRKSGHLTPDTVAAAARTLALDGAVDDVEPNT
jgi:hypothetical protein